MSTRGRNEPRAAELLARDHTLHGSVLYGLDGRVIELQARAVGVLGAPGSWRGNVKIVGMARGAVNEAIDRIGGALSKLGMTQTPVEVLINLAPADLPKEGTWLDLPLAVIMLQAAGKLPDLPAEYERRYVLVGELGLHGEVRRVPGVLSMASGAGSDRTLIVPKGNERECALVTADPTRRGCRVCSVETLEEVLEFFRGERTLASVLNQELAFEPVIGKGVDFGRIKGQERAKQAALISAAGGHNLLLVGPPGEGKSLLASAMPGILPRLSAAEKVELTRIYSACGQLERDGMCVTRRPMRPVHHTASKQAIVGGGSGTPTPGEVTLAHLGVLFMDELAEFARPTLETLRQPIENGEVTISRVDGTLTFPCRFTLLAAMNPCPCGYFGTPQCRCKASEVKAYQGKISGPILDRIDLQVELSRLTTEERFAESGEEQSPKLRALVEAARERQQKRFEGKGIPHNAAIPGGHVRDYCNFSDAGFERFKKTIDASTLTTRSMDRLAKVSRTVADLAQRETVEPEDLETAAGFVVGGMLRDGA